LSLRIIDVQMARASAGEARAMALQAALEYPGIDVILTTDADAVAPDDWIDGNLAALARGAEVVCGTAGLLPADAATIPARLIEDDRIEVECAMTLDALDAAIDPDPADPWPRHQQHSGATIAVTAAALRRAGGPPSVPTGEDRTLIAQLRLVDARIRHAPDVSVAVSGRLDGRAVGGMAETIRRRLATRDVLADETLEPAIDAYRRALAKARLRAVRQTGTGVSRLAEDLLITREMVQEALASPYFGTAWAEIQSQSPVLQRRRLRVDDLLRETRRARWLLEQLMQRPVTQAIASNDQPFAS
jgi:hypothetical protein